MSIRVRFRGKGAHAPIGPKAFIIGAWLQDVSTMAYWAGLGVNTQVSDYGNGGTQAAWKAAAIANGMKVFQSGYATWDDHANQVNDQYAALANDSDVVGIFQYDEPDLNGPPIVDMQAEHAKMRAAGNNKPMWINLRSAAVTSDYSGFYPFVNLDVADIPSTDAYGWNGDTPYVYGDYYFPEGLSGNPFSTMVGHATRILYQGPWHTTPLTRTVGRPTMQFIACGRVFDPPWFDPPVGVWQTATQYRLQFWSSVINGASGLINFPQYFPASGPMIPNDTNSELAGAITDAAAKIAILEGQPGGNVLMDQVNGGRRAYTFRPCTNVSGGSAGGPNWPAQQPSFDATTGIQMPPWFEGAELSNGNGETYWLGANIHETLTKTLTDSRWGKTADSFGPGQVKLWKASAPTVDLFA